MFRIVIVILIYHRHKLIKLNSILSIWQTQGYYLKFNSRKLRNTMQNGSELRMMKRRVASINRNIMFFFLFRKM
jgi:hypothetical protein